MSPKTRWALIGLMLLGLGCEGEASKKSAASHAGSGSNASAPAEPSKASIEYRTLGEKVQPNGHVVDVKMIGDNVNSPRFEPSTVRAHRGDVVDFVNMNGVHNVHFPAEKNPGVHVPPATEPLRLSGEAYDLVVGAKPGTYYFQSDADARVGMVGTLIVQ